MIYKGKITTMIEGISKQEDPSFFVERLHWR